MQVYSGGRFFPEDPRPEEVQIEDIARGLSNICRYNGQGRFLSVAQHSILMARRARKMGTASKVQMATLLHDASEAYTGDKHKAIKHALGSGFKEIEDNIQRTVFRKYGVESVAHLCRGFIKSLDNGIIPTEKAYVFGGRCKYRWAADDIGPLPGLKVRWWPCWWAEWMFLREFRLLAAAINVEEERSMSHKDSTLEVIEDRRSRPQPVRGVLARFPRAILALAEVSSYGTTKYDLDMGDVSYKDLPDADTMFAEAEVRHVLNEAIEGPLSQDGRECEPQRTMYHKAQKAWNALADLEVFLDRSNSYGA